MISKLMTEPPQAAAGYLGPATVLAVQGRRVQLECPDEFPWATMALAHSYQPVEGDSVLAISRDRDWYVIGVLEGRGPSTITAPADLEFRAPRGCIRFIAKEEITFRSRLVELVARKLDVTAASIFERCTEATRWVRDSLHQRMGRVRTKVESDYEIKAGGRIVERADGDVRIDGKTIHVG